MQEIFKNSLAKSLTYADYRKQVTDLLKEGKSTGNEQSEDLTKYSELNEVRMNRLDKTIQISDEVKIGLSNLQANYLWIVISEGWCGDAAQLLPIINKMAELSENIDLRIVFRDENEDLMNQYLTNGGKAIPKLLILDAETLTVLSDWGPRPEGAKNLILDYKAQFGIVDEIAKTNLQKWYLHDKGLSTQTEIMALVEKCEKQLV
ncbi:MAG TPA: thioredoxin family protein [Flavobacterium sp.]|uniref:thioredoxin family protein n=1 Tax=unclassified Flavobacterium TaxID=196869 RepID=UPI000E84F5AB|nr:MULTISPECIES: thioredoxin family protein [unclassified Flavobacterium]HBI00839.1 thioredoxin family protein [Flavobacterium sp.]HRE77593.1 thioredoxin family protein [Flavobacterium sp.]